MSGSMSALRFEDHFGPVVPEVAPSPANSTSAPSRAYRHTAALRALAAQMRHCVVTATATPDPAAKAELWESYRSARAQALAMLASTSGIASTSSIASTSGIPRLRSL